MGLKFGAILKKKRGRLDFLAHLIVLQLITVATFGIMTILLLIITGFVMNQRLNDTKYKDRIIRKGLTIASALFGNITVCALAAIIAGIIREDNALYLIYPVVLFFIFIPLYLFSLLSFFTLLIDKEYETTYEFKTIEE